MRRTPSLLVIAALAMPAVALAEPAPGWTVTPPLLDTTVAARPRDVMVPTTVPPRLSPLVNTHILYLNNCLPGGCTVKSGTTDSRYDTSDIVSGGQHTLSAWRYGASKWNQVVDCVKQVMAPFNITVTDQDPGTVDHFEVMIAGDPSEVGLPGSVGGIADYPCQQPGVCSDYIADALVFDFADVWGGDVTYSCGTAAQEIAHAWTLDHTISASDPMTYKNFVSPLAFKDGVQCGSDCQYQCPGGSGACNAFGIQCSGSGLNGTHICMGTNQATQDELKIIKALFGPAGAKAPTVKITEPSNGTAVQTGMGFAIKATCDSGDGVQEVDLSIDDVPRSRLTAPPFEFMAPSNLTEGTHKITVLCGTNQQATATDEINVVGDLCQTDTDCQTGYICYQSACIAGPDSTGGLGATCTGNGDCISGACASDGTTSSCVIPCDPSNDQCPSGFGCLEAGTSGVCWFGVEGGGGGCCDAGGGGPLGSILLSAGFATTLITRRRRRRR